MNENNLFAEELFRLFYPKQPEPMSAFEKRLWDEAIKQRQDQHESWNEHVEYRRQSDWWLRRFSHANRLDAKVSLVADYNRELRNEDPYEDYR